MEKEFVPYEQALELKELGFDEPCMYAWCITLEHRVEYDGKMSLKTDGNPFGQFYKGKSFNRNYIPNKNKIQCSAPLKQQAFRWFREKHNILANVYSNASGFLFEYHDTIGGTHRYDSDITGPNDAGCWDTYEEAELACLIKLIEIIKSL